MAALTPKRIGDLLEPYYPGVDARLAEQLSIYLELLVKWNARTNLTAIREPEEMVRRHFGESLFVAQHLPEGCTTLLDLGSGAGFPGLPIQLVRAELRVTLAEAQNKKAAFLREVLRTLGLETEVWGARAETMHVGRRFDVVTMRAVDRPNEAMLVAREFLSPGGTIARLSASDEMDGLIRVPGRERTVLELIS